jgi:hypothetical protein
MSNDFIGGCNAEQVMELFVIIMIPIFIEILTKINHSKPNLRFYNGKGGTNHEVIIGDNYLCV